MAGYVRTVQPSVEPVTLAEAKEQAVVTAGTADDALLTRLIRVARTEAEQATGRTLIDSTWVRTMDRFTPVIRLLNGPVNSVVSVKFDDEDGAEQTLVSTDYTLDKGAGLVAYVVPAYDKSWPATREQINAVRVTYTAGFGASGADVPEDIRHWILMRVATLYEHREAIVVGAGLATAQLPFVSTLLDPYRVPVI